MSFVNGAEEVVGNSPYENYKFEDVGQAVTGLFVGVEERNSREYGDFVVVLFVSFDASAKDIPSAVASAKLLSIPFATVLLNKYQGGALARGECYTIEMVLAKGDKYENSKTGKQEKAKANHFKILHLSVPDEGIAALEALVPGSGPAMVQGARPVKEPGEELPDEAPAPKAKPRI